MPEPLGMILSMLLSLALVLFLAWFVLGYIGKRSGSRAGSAGAVKVLDRVIVGKDQSILLVKAGSKTLLIGFSNGSSTVLCEFGDDEHFDIAAAQMPDFSNILKSAASKWRSKGEKEDKPDEK